MGLNIYSHSVVKPHAHTVKEAESGGQPWIWEYSSLVSVLVCSLCDSKTL